MEERISFDSDRQQLAGVLHAPQGVGPRERRPAFLQLRGFGSNKESETMILAGRRPARWGYAALRSIFWALATLCLLIPLAGTAAAEGAESSAGSAEPRVWHNIPYASTARSHLLDLYLPATGGGPFPVILWVHGGAWHEGSKGLAEYPLPLRVLERGYALASMNYRLSWEAKFPAQIDDVKAAVRWLRANAKPYHLDQSRIGAWGGSAGGYLVALLGTSGDVPDLEYLGLGNPRESSRVQAVVVWSAPIDFLRLDEHAAAKGCSPYEGRGHSSPSSPESDLLGFPITERPERVKATNPIRYVSPDDPPFFIQHGEFDCTVAPQQSQLLYDALAPVIGSGKVTLMYLPAGHGGEPFEKDSNIGLILDFFDKYLK